MLGGHLVGVALADIAAQAHVQSRVLQQIVDEAGGGSLAVGAGDANLLGTVEAAGELNLAHHADALLANLLHHGHGTRDAGALHHLIGIQDKLLRMLPLLKGNVPLPQGIGITVLDLSLVAKKHIESFHFCQNCGSYAALGTT